MAFEVQLLCPVHQVGRIIGQVSTAPCVVSHCLMNVNACSSRTTHAHAGRLHRPAAAR